MADPDVAVSSRRPVWGAARGPRPVAASSSAAGVEARRPRLRPAAGMEARRPRPLPAVGVEAQRARPLPAADEEERRRWGSPRRRQGATGMRAAEHGKKFFFIF